ncbi:MAG TPA: metal-dependent hydrolase [Candidatus Korarchaeota archaeon]|nr:metal-dependent hydrolase [Candidatus Korarchaeota archaeon]
MVKVTFLGHSAFLLEGSKRILIDPWIEANPQAPVSLDQCKGADIYVITHAHGDHGLEDAVKLAKRHGGTIVSIYEIASEANSKGVERTVGANVGSFFEVDGVKIALTTAIHSSPIGAPTGAVVELDGKRIYHAGDTGVFYGMKLIGELYKPDLALLPIGGHFVMGPLEAAKAVELLGVKKVIPMHYGTFPVLKGRPEEFIELLKQKGIDAEVIVLKPGESYEL